MLLSHCRFKILLGACVSLMGETERATDAARDHFQTTSTAISSIGCVHWLREAFMLP